MPRANCHSVLAILCLAGCAGAQPAAVTGQITESLHGKPVAKVQVTLRSPADAAGMVDVYAATTGADGRYQIHNIPPGRYSVAFTRVGFVGPLRKDGSLEFPPPVVLSAGAQRTLDAQLTPAGVVSGRILDADGDPVRGVTVSLMQASAIDKREVVRGNAISDDRGEYRLYDVLPGVYYLRAVGTSGTSLKVAAGEELSGNDVHMRPAVFYTVHLKVLTRHPQGGSFEFALESLSGDGKVQYATGEPLEFRSVLPGSYRLTGILHRQARLEPEGYLRLNVEVVDRDLDLVAPPFVAGMDIPGKIRADGPIPFQLERLRIDLGRDAPDRALPNPTAVVAADGTFLLRSVVADSYTLRFSVPAGAYVKSVTVGNRESADLHIDLSAGAAPLTIRLATDGGRIAGTVENGTRTPVMLVADGAHRERIRSTATDESGGFVWEDVPPGDYRLYAWEGADLAAAQDGDFRRQYEAQSVPVTVAPRSSQTVSLKTVVVQERVKE